VGTDVHAGEFPFFPNTPGRNPFVYFFAAKKNWPKGPKILKKPYTILQSEKKGYFCARGPYFGGAKIAQPSLWVFATGETKVGGFESISKTSAFPHRFLDFCDGRLGTGLMRPPGGGGGTTSGNTPGAFPRVSSPGPTSKIRAAFHGTLRGGTGGPTTNRGGGGKARPGSRKKKIHWVPQTRENPAKGAGKPGGRLGSSKGCSFVLVCCTGKQKKHHRGDGRGPVRLPGQSRLFRHGGVLLGEAHQGLVRGANSRLHFLLLGGEQENLGNSVSGSGKKKLSDNFFAFPGPPGLGGKQLAAGGGIRGKMVVADFPGGGEVGDGFDGAGARRGLGAQFVGPGDLLGGGGGRGGGTRRKGRILWIFFYHPQHGEIQQVHFGRICEGGGGPAGVGAS